MYDKFYGLSSLPFREDGEPHIFYLSKTLREKCVHILEVLRTERGCALLTGQTGVGKTAFSRILLQNLDKHIRTVHISEKVENSKKLLELICKSLRIELGASFSKTEAVMYLHNFLENLSAQRKHCVVIVDDAHALSHEVLEELFLLSEFEPATGKALQICLVGRPGLLEILDKPAFSALKGAIKNRFEILPLTIEETGAYIKHRLNLASFQMIGDLFDQGAVEVIFELSGGVARSINFICEKALQYGSEANCYAIDSEIIKRAAGTQKDKIDDDLQKEDGDNDLQQWDLDALLAEDDMDESELLENSTISQNSEDRGEGVATPDPVRSPDSTDRQREQPAGRKASSSHLQKTNTPPSFEDSGEFKLQPGKSETLTVQESSSGRLNGGQHQNIERNTLRKENSRRKIDSEPPRAAPAPSKQQPVQGATIDKRTLRRMAASIQWQVERTICEKYILIKKPPPNARPIFILIGILGYILTILIAALIMK